MTKILMAAAVACGCLCGGAASAFAQANENPLGLDYGPLHPAVPPQVTTYYPPSQPSVTRHRFHRFHRVTY